MKKITLYILLSILSINCLGQKIVKHRRDFSGQVYELLQQQTYIKDIRLENFIKFFIQSEVSTVSCFMGIDEYAYVMKFYTYDERKAFFILIYAIPYESDLPESSQFYTIIEDRIFLVFNPPKWVFDIESEKNKIIVKEKDLCTGYNIKKIIRGVECNKGEYCYDIVFFDKNKYYLQKKDWELNANE